MSTINSVVNLTAVNANEMLPIDGCELVSLNSSKTKHATSMFEVASENLAIFHAAFEANMENTSFSVDPAMLENSKHMRLYNKIFVK